DQATSATDASINGGTPTPSDIVANDFAALGETQPTATDQTGSPIDANANAGAPTPSDIIAGDFASLGQSQPTGQDQAAPTTDAAPPPAPDTASIDVTAP